MLIINKIPFGDTQLILTETINNETSTFSVNDGTESFSNLEDLINKYPALVSAPYIDALVTTANFFLGKETYVVIAKDFEEYRKKYSEKIANEKEGKISGICLSSFGVRDVSVLEAPTLENRVLTFYAQSRQNGVPYQAVVNFQSSPVLGTYSPLPCKE